MEHPEWFNMTARPNFEGLVKELNPELSLQIGVFTGVASMWLMENTDTFLVDCDTWQGGGDITDVDFNQVYKLYRDTTEPHRKRIVECVLPSATYLKQLDQAYPRFDFIYIDGGHTAKNVIEDAVLAYPHLKVGGIMAFDDYTWQCGSHLDEPKMGINAFASIYGREMECIRLSHQAWFKKVA